MATCLCPQGCNGMNWKDEPLCFSCKEGGCPLPPSMVAPAPAEALIQHTFVESRFNDYCAVEIDGDYCKRPASWHVAAPPVGDLPAGLLCQGICGLEALERVRDRGTMEDEDTRIAARAIATVKAMDEAELATGTR